MVLLNAAAAPLEAAARRTPGAVSPPFGLYSLVAVLRQHGYDVLLIELSAGSWSTPRLEAALASPDGPPMAIGVSAYTEGACFALDLIRWCKALYPHSALIAGGPHFSFLPDEALDAGADFVVRFEAEATLIALLEHVKCPSLALDKIDGLAFRRDELTVRTATRNRISALDHLPFSSRLILDHLDSPRVHLLSSRGCPGRCIFCSSPAFSGRRLRALSAEHVFSVMWYALTQSDHSRGFNFTDDVFTVDRDRLSRIIRYLSAAGLTVEWEARCRVDQLSESFIAFLAEHGCRSLHVGVESADQDVLRSIQKDISISSFLENFPHLLANGILPRCSFMIGHHSDSLRSIERTVLLATAIEEYGLGKVAVGISTPFPGTVLQTNSDRYRIDVVVDKWSAYSMTRPIYVTPAFSQDDLRRALYLFHNDRQLILRDGFLTGTKPTTDLFRDQVLQWAHRMRIVLAGRRASDAERATRTRPEPAVRSH